MCHCCVCVRTDRIEAVRRELARNNISSPDSATIQCMELLGEGTYGKVGGCLRVPIAAV